MNVQHIIREALQDYDSVKPVIRYLEKNTYYEGTKTASDTVRSTFKFIDKETHETIIETEIEILAIFYDKLNVWSWGWAQTGLTNSENYLSREILLYALKLDPSLSYLKSVLTTSRGVINDLTQLDINLALSSSVIKKPYIYPFYHKVDNNYLIYYIILINDEPLNALKSKLTESGKSYITSDET